MTKNKTEKMNGKKAVVFGGSGFLGSHVADALTDSGFRVIIFDCKQSKYLQSGQEMHIGNILDMEQVSFAVKDVDVVYHFAGIADIHEANEKPMDTVMYNIVGTTTILEACVKANIPLFVFASSVYVYSEHGGFYRSSKQACELLIENYNKLYNLTFTILRFGSLYGRRASKSNFIYNIIHQALTEGRMERKGDGEELRAYIHISDAARACVSIINEKFNNEYILLTGSQTIKVKDMLHMINEMLSNEIKIHFLDERIEEHYEITPYTFRPRLARNLFLDTQIDLGQGILDTIYDVYKILKRGKESKLVISIPD